jgi:hypothetical protein
MGSLLEPAASVFALLPMQRPLDLHCQVNMVLLQQLRRGAEAASDVRLSPIIVRKQRCCSCTRLAYT